MSKILIIFGAGASADLAPPGFSTAHNDLKPPLTNGLFSHNLTDGLLDETTFLGSSIGEIREKIERGENVEELLKYYDNLARSGTESRVKLLDDLIWYLGRLFSYCSKHINHGSNYQRLLNFLNDNKITSTLVTFNYDTLIEKAITSVHGVQYTNIEDYIVSPTPLIKLHGSWNWINSDAGISLYPANNSLPKAQRTEDRLNIRLGIPLAARKGFLVPVSHLFTLEKALQDIDLIITVGWRGDEPHFFDWIKDRRDWGSKPYNLYSVGNSADGCQQMLKKFSAISPPNHFEFYHGGFSGFFRDDQHKQILTLLEK